MRSTSMWCQRNEQGLWVHFARHPEVSRLYEPTLSVFAATVTEVDQSSEGYWGWWDNEKEQFLFVYASRGLVDMCFPYGSRAEEERGRGHLLPVQIVTQALVPKPSPRKSGSQSRG